MVFLHQTHDGFKNHPMVKTIKIVLVDNVVDFIPRHIIQHQAAQDRLLRLDRMRRRAQQRQIITHLNIIHNFQIRSCCVFIFDSNPSKPLIQKINLQGIFFNGLLYCFLHRIAAELPKRIRV